MTKNVKILIGIGSAIALGTAGYFIFRPEKEEFTSEDDQSTENDGLGSYSGGSSSGSSSSTPVSNSAVQQGLLAGIQAWITGGGSSVADSPNNNVDRCSREGRYPLRQGSTGANVKKVQQFLNKFGTIRVSEDCIYGGKTEDAVNRFFEKEYKAYARGKVTKLVFDNIIQKSLRDGQLVDLSAYQKAYYFI